MSSPRLNTWTNYPAGSYAHRARRRTPNLWDRLSGNFRLRPGVAYAFGLTVCGALGLSAVYMVKHESTETADASSGTVLRGPVVADNFASLSIQRHHHCTWPTGCATQTQPLNRNRSFPCSPPLTPRCLFGTCPELTGSNFAVGFAFGGAAVILPAWNELPNHLLQLRTHGAPPMSGARRKAPSCPPNP